MELFKQMVVVGCRADVITCNTLIGGMCKTGKISVAIKLLEEMVNGHKEFGVICRPNVVTYNTIIDGLCKARLVEKATQLLLEHMIQRGVVPNVYTYTILLNGYCLADRIGDARELFDSITRKGYRPDVVCYTTLINWEIRNYFEPISEIFSSLKLVPNVVTYNILINGLCKNGQLEMANKLLLYMEGKGCAPDVVSFTTLMFGFLKNNEIQKVVGLLHKMAEKNVKSTECSMSLVMQLLMKAENYHECLNELPQFPVQKRN
ncbi:pentatricopeptide repeat-containing protein At1g12775, mitochondrial-like [Pistacia vera]|uniref:pentatricopeptide repeat-containing protein At1g12775, mitochondrial-like n=1 Tax=Pistacia vera TaxID=55513 RepID=UPI001263B2A7|nr:pentatricopeptide repeat-containing protein At1g12775, mitochondrial-like [Pistacia vera]